MLQHSNILSIDDHHLFNINLILLSCMTLYFYKLEKKQAHRQLHKFWYVYNLTLILLVIIIN